MRDVKFRVWNTETNKMIINVKEMGAFALKSIYTIDEFLVIPTDEKYPLMQYTGLKDKNNIEIYEGDIVKWGHLPNRNECWHRVAFVEMFPCLQFHILHYIDGKTLEKKKGDNHIYGFSNFIYKDTYNSLEVIGNIYENKELLK